MLTSAAKSSVFFSIPSPVSYLTNLLIATPEPISAPELISLCSPHESENNQFTVWLFHIEEDAHLSQSGYFQQSGNIQRVQPSYFQLSFLLTPHSKAPSQLKEADQYRMLGAAMQIIKDMPQIPRDYLEGSLLNSGAELRLSVERPNFDQMIKIWNNTATPYKASIVCKINGVAIESKRAQTISRVTDIKIDTMVKPENDDKR